jgi:molybdopterin converting factor small subunit
MSAPKAPAGYFTVLYFATSKSYTRKDYDFFPAPLLLSQVPDLLEKQYPGIKEKVLESCAWNVNIDYVDLEEETAKGAHGLMLQPGDDLVVVPPVSAG